MTLSAESIVAAFAGDELIARGPLREVAERYKTRLDGGERQRMALFDDDTGRSFDLDLSGSLTEALARLPRPAGDPAAGDDSKGKPRGRGRPKLGVVSREVSLLPRHWAWLAEQRVGASAALRRLVEAAAKSESGEAVVRRSVDAAHRFIWDIAGDQPGFEEATRALFAHDFERLAQLTAEWPPAIVVQLTRFVDRARATRPGEGST